MNRDPIPTIEWQTLALIVGNYVAFVVVCINYHVLPWWLVVVMGAVMVCLHGSLQHEAIHGHPTRHRRLNEWLVYPALGLWLPYEIYRDTHLKHHIDEYITDPFEDPESYFVTGKNWQHCGAMQRACLLVRNTVLGRLVLGPLWTFITFSQSEIISIARGDTTHLRYWGWHAVSVALVLWWLNFCDIPIAEYVLLFAYPGLSLTMLRSFLEHQADPDPARRTAVVKSGRLMGLLFLNNNLHALHHEQPALPWYRLPAEYSRRSAEILSRNGGYFYTGYLQIIRRHLLSPKTHPRHPFI
ncbi:MAG: fatty acid desaturase [Pseudomonadota bacterium]